MSVIEKCLLTINKMFLFLIGIILWIVYGAGWWRDKKKKSIWLAVFELFFSLDPDSDPLCMLLLIDFLALRSREYHLLLQLYQDWEVHVRVHATVWIFPLHCLFLHCRTTEICRSCQTSRSPLHFANSVWARRRVEIMKKETDTDT